MSKLASGLSQHYDKMLGPKVSKFTHHPVKVNAKEAAGFLKNCKNIVVLTGAGLSLASGIPTFRGPNGFWNTSYGEYDDPKKILTMETFNKCPEIVWQWQWDFVELKHKCKPNKGHHAILQFQ
jgi:NAD-dependent deacetylase